MATNPAPTARDASVSKPVPLWSAPVFVFGVAALVAVSLCRPLFPDQPNALRRDLAAAQAELMRPDGDVEEVIRLVNRAVASIHTSPDRAGEAALLLGEANIRLAERAEPDKGGEYWRLAAEHLARAEQAGVSKDYQLALLFRMGKVGFYTKGDPRQVIERLEQCADQIEKRAEAFDLLTRAYLQLNPPGLEKALEANNRLRDVPDLTAAELAAAQLLGGELLLRLKKPEEARKSLQKINSTAPPQIRLRARLLEARSFQDEGRWANAAKLYEEVLKPGSPPVPQPAQIYYNLGLCYHKLNKPTEAANAWAECAKQAGGKESQAAAIVLAKQRLLDPASEQFPKALDDLNSAVENVTAPEKWNNPLVDLAAACKVFEQGISAYRQAGKSDLALKALEPYSRLAPPRRVLELRASLSAERARALKDEGKGQPNPLAAGEITQLFRQAADAYGKATELPNLKPNELADFLWAAVPCHLECGENDKAITKLEWLIKLELAPVRMGEVWYLLAEEYRTAGKSEEADKAYRECMKYDTRFAYLARYQLAMAALRAGAMDEATTILHTNIRLLMSWESEPEALAQSLFAYCNLLYQRKRYREVVRDLEIALNRHSDRFKDKTELARAKYQLADSYRQIAAQENQNFLLGETLSADARTHFQKQHLWWLEKAAIEFGNLDDFLNKPEGEGCLTSEQRMQVPFITAKCWFNLGQYTKALTIYEKLIDRNKGKVQGLDALGGAVSCHAALGQVNHVRQRLVEIKKALEEFPEEVRKPWEQWLNEAIKGLKDLKEP